MPKVFIVNSGQAYKALFMDFGFTILTSLDDGVPDLVCFTGGEDVSPDLYGEQRHPHTYASQYRDVCEKKLFTEFVEADIPMVGICRGGQFLNVMNGGKMYQHVSMHTGSHPITDVKSKSIVIATSTHHQMMRPGIGGEILAIANQNGFKQYMQDGKVVADTSIQPDVEVVFYPNTSCLCFQPHPEFGSDELRVYFFNLIDRYLINITS